MAVMSGTDTGHDRLDTVVVYPLLDIHSMRYNGFQ